MTTPSLPINTEERGDALKKWREAVFLNVARFIAYAATLAYVVLMGVVFEDLQPFFFVVYTLAYALILISAFVSRIPVVYRAYTLVFLIYALGVFSAIEKASLGDGRVWFVLSAIFAVVFLGRRVGLALTLTVTLTWAVLGYMFSSGFLAQPHHDQFSFDIWGGTTITLFVTGLSTVLSIGALLRNLNKTINDSLSLAKISDEQSRELAEQHDALQRRSSALEASARISRKVASLTTSDDILMQTPIMVKSNFNLLSVALFLLGQDSILRLASCEGWNEQAYPRHDYAVSLEEDITGAAIIQNKALSNHTSEKGLQASLPDTRSFAAIPLRGRSNSVKGVMLLQSFDFDGLGEERLATLQILADQTAILMENADLLVAKESALDAERRAYGDITGSAWSDFVSEQSYGGYRRDAEGLKIVPTKPFQPDNENPSCHQVPIRIRGKVIGYVDAHKPEMRAWTISEKDLLDTLARRLESALDSARLYDEIQERANREHLVSQASSRMRESLDVQTVLRAAAEELHRVLGGVAETEIWIAPEDINDDPAID